MLIFLLNTFFCTIKLLAISWFTNDQVFLKFVIIFLLVLLIIILYKFPKPLENSLGAVESYYKIHNKNEKIISFIMLLLYIIIFFGGILGLRYMNNTKTLDLRLIYNKIYIMLYNDFMISFINITLIILVIITYALLLKKLIKFFKRYFIKLHIYYSKYDNNWYDTYIKDTFTYKFDYKSIINNISKKHFPLIRKEFFTFELRYHLIIFVKYIHYIILIFVLFYDIIFNNMILSKIYVIFPYIFLYDCYIKLCNLYDSLDILYSADFNINNYIYAKNIVIINNEEIWVNDEPYDAKYIARIILVYLKNGLNAELLAKASDDCITYNAMYKYSYYKDWKSRKKKHK